MRSAVPASGFSGQRGCYVSLEGLDGASVNVSRPVQADLLVLVHVDVPAILYNQGYGSETDLCQRLVHQSFKIPAPGFGSGV